MDKSYRSNRQVIVSMSKVGVLISFAWSEGESHLNRQLRSTHLAFAPGIVMDSVDKALDVFVPTVGHELPEAGQIIVVEKCAPDNYDKFDLVADAEEPEQAFVSRYVLEA